MPPGPQRPPTLHDQKSGESRRSSPQLREFKGLNIQDARQGIEDGEFAWCENAMVLGKGKVQILPYMGSSIASFAGGVATFRGVVLNGSPVFIVVGTDGSLKQVTPSGTVTSIAAAGTVTTAADVAMWQSTVVLIGDPVKGYFSWDGATFTTIDAAKLPTSLDVYAGRVWLVKGRTRTYSAPGSYTDFTAGNGGGSSILIDNAFPGNITTVVSALDQLWQFGPGGINAISNVQVPAGQTQPTFSDTNVVSTVGTIYPGSAISFFRAMAMMTAAGVYSLVGVTPQPLSEKICNLFPLLTLGTDVPAGLCYLYQIPVLSFLVTYNDPVAGARPLLLCYSQGKWFQANQGALTWISSVLVDGQWQLYGTDGTSIYQCFGGSASTAVPYKIQSKLWDFGAAIQTKEIFKFMLEFYASSTINPTITIDSGAGGTSQVISITSVVQWINNQRNIVSWQSLQGGTVQWIRTAAAQAFAPVALQGNYLGWTISGTDIPWSFSATAMEIEPRREW